MDMVAHENIGVDGTVISIFVDGKQLEVFLIVGGRFKDLLLLVPTGDDMVERAFEFYTRLPWHSQSLQEGV
jgi:hypothetical protein